MIDLADKLSERLLEVPSGCWEFIGAGMHVKGSRQGQSKLVEDDIPIIRKLLSDEFSCREIARLYSVTDTAIFYIRTGQNWGWLK
jgi:hypothetical protein